MEVQAVSLRENGRHDREGRRMALAKWRFSPGETHAPEKKPQAFCPAL